MVITSGRIHVNEGPLSCRYTTGASGVYRCLVRFDRYQGLKCVSTMFINCGTNLFENGISQLQISHLNFVDVNGLKTMPIKHLITGWYVAEKDERTPCAYPRWPSGCNVKGFGLLDIDSFCYTRVISSYHSPLVCFREHPLEYRKNSEEDGEFTDANNGS